MHKIKHTVNENARECRTQSTSPPPESRHQTFSINNIILLHTESHLYSTLLLPALTSGPTVSYRASSDINAVGAALVHQTPTSCWGTRETQRGRVTPIDLASPSLVRQTPPLACLHNSIRVALQRTAHSHADALAALVPVRDARVFGTPADSRANHGPEGVSSLQKP